KMNSFQSAEVSYLVHVYASQASLQKLAEDMEFYTSRGPKFAGKERYNSQAEVVAIALATRQSFSKKSLAFLNPVLKRMLEVLTKATKIDPRIVDNLRKIIEGQSAVPTLGNRS